MCIKSFRVQSIAFDGVDPSLSVSGAAPDWRVVVDTRSSATEGIPRQMVPTCRHARPPRVTTNDLEERVRQVLPLLRKENHQ